MGAGPIVSEFTVVSVSIGDNWDFNRWDDIRSYWETAGSGLGSTGWTEGQPVNGVRTLALLHGSRAVASSPVVSLQSRDYLTENSPNWSGGAATGGLLRRAILGGEEDMLSPLQTNAYPFSFPQLSDDGDLLVYLSDADSSDVTDAEVRFSQESGGKFPEGSAIPGPDDFPGYGDSSLRFDGTSSFAGAAWLREAVTLELPAGSALEDDQVSMLLGGLEVMASVWNGSTWETVRITENGSQDMDPVIAVNGGKAIVAWRSIQSGAGFSGFEQERILYRIYNGTDWSEPYTLFNGSFGSVKGMSAEMLPDGTASVAYTLDSGTAAPQGAESGCEIWYAVMDTASADPEASAKVIRATTDEDLDETPRLTTTKMGDTDVFVLGWHNLHSQSGAEQHDIGLRVFDRSGTPRNGFPEALSDMVSTASFDGQFSFAKGADTLERLSLVWNDGGVGKENNDILRAVKFAEFDGSYIVSAPIEVAQLPARTTTDHFDFYVSDSQGTQIKGAVQATTFSDTEFEEDMLTFDLDGTPTTGTVQVPKEEVNLYTAVETYQNDFEVSDIAVDFSTLALNAQTPISFTITNQGMDALTGLTLEVDGTERYFSGLGLLPGRSKTISLVYPTGNAITDPDYTATAEFAQNGSVVRSGTVYLDYPDVGIAALAVTEESGGLRSFQTALYDQSPASLPKDGRRRVVLSVCSDPECKTPLDGKYFTDGTVGEPYELVLSDSGILNALDNGGYAQPITFRIGDYIADAGLAEIPSAGVTLFLRVRVEDRKDGEWVTLPEADLVNNQVSHSFESLLDRSGGAPVTLTVRVDNSADTTAEVTVQNNSLSRRSSGNIIASLLDQNGALLETQQSYTDGLIDLGTEGTSTKRFQFTRSGADVRVTYGDTVTGSSNANVGNITLAGLPLSLASFDAAGSAELTGVPRGSYLLTVVPENPEALVTVDGVTAPDGTREISMVGADKSILITVTSPDQSTTTTYTLILRTTGGSHGGGSSVTSYAIIVVKAENGSVAINPRSASEGDTVTITATPDKGYTLETLTVTDKNGNQLKLSEKDGKYTFQMPDSRVTITVTFAKSELAGANPFVDVARNAYYYDAVLWAAEQGITSGTSATTFSPNASCTRGQMVTFLWRANGSPTPQSSQMPFTDVPEDAYYYHAVLWAVEMGITSGTSETTFSPNMTVTRSQTVTFLWRTAEEPIITESTPFTDADDPGKYYYHAVAWAVSEGVTSGTSATTFSPGAPCTRAQIVTFLWRDLAK